MWSRALCVVQDEPSLPWVHAFSLELELSSLLALVLAPLKPPAADENPAPTPDLTTAPTPVPTADPLKPAAADAAEPVHAGAAQKAKKHKGAQEAAAAMQATPASAPPLLTSTTSLAWRQLERWLQIVAEPATSPTTRSCWWLARDQGPGARDQTRESIGLDDEEQQAEAGAGGKGGRANAGGERAPFSAAAAAASVVAWPGWSPAQSGPAQSGPAQSGPAQSDPVVQSAPAVAWPEWKHVNDHPQMLSHHLPLHRTLGALLQAGLQYEPSARAVLPLTSNQAHALAEHPLRLQLLPMQLRMRW